ncbi:hypothetical protein Taro_004759 [Colocasia esculenta]|uniref:Alpha-N-acetylglucosaminidase C-terminal domain-containing protein n=1 Tax=Colocasia esculenta TaxID=4460 RepID=A0A843TVV1_COLES|nr:hypothetical protein [Colocasia esculenta]
MFNQDHNRDYIVQFPDRGPYYLSQESVTMKPHRKQHNRFSLRETATTTQSPHLWYSPEEVLKALKLFLDSGDKLEGSLTYRYDLVDLTRQVLSKLGNQIYLDVMVAYIEKDVNALTLRSQKLTELIKDIDTLLASDDNFLLGTWLESAKSLATNQKERKQYEWNARTQVTMWFDNTETNQSRLHDYANKCWSGLLESYYLPRASMYFSYLLESLRQGVHFPLEMWRREWISYSNKWQSGEELYPTKAIGNSHAIAKELAAKYFT